MTDTIERIVWDLAKNFFAKKTDDTMGFFGENDDGKLIEGTITRDQYKAIRLFKNFKLEDFVETDESSWEAILKKQKK